MVLAVATTPAGFGPRSTVDAEGEPDSAGYAFDTVHRQGAPVQETPFGSALLSTRRDAASPTVKTSLAARDAAGSAPEQTCRTQRFVAGMPARGNA